MLKSIVSIMNYDYYDTAMALNRAYGEYADEYIDEYIDDDDIDVMIFERILAAAEFTVGDAR